MPREPDRKQHHLLKLQLNIWKAGLKGLVHFTNMLAEVQVRDPPGFPRAIRRVCRPE